VSRKADLVRAWLLKAEHDLESSRILIRDEKRLLDVAVYHCQQAGEKALKAYLTEHDTIFPKTHELGELLNLCLPTNHDFERLRHHAETLSPLAHQFRYPGDAVEPSAGEAAEALRMAEEIYRFCQEQLASE
jgi:HEPN domain-containing protein